MVIFCISFGIFLVVIIVSAVVSSVRYNNSTEGKKALIENELRSLNSELQFATPFFDGKLLAKTKREYIYKRQRELYDAYKKLTGINPDDISDY